MIKKHLKTVISSFLALLMTISMFTIPANAAAALNATAITITKGYSSTLKVTGTTGSVTWSTGDNSIATVSSAGKVVGKGVGSTYIYAKVSGSTLKCKVTVVAGKITSSASSLSLDKGTSKKVNITAKGTHSIVVSSSDKSVATASWNGAKFNGDVIPLTITGVGSGTCQIKVYAKNYPSTVYANINITIGSTTDDVLIVPTSDSVTVDVGSASTFRVYTSIANSISVMMANTGIATATVGSSNGKYTDISIKGISAGSTTLRISSKTNSKNYEDIKVTVGSASQYYVVSNTIPSKILQSDLVIQYSVNNVTRYMLVPTNYDEAYANTLFASATYSYNYYTVYTNSPQKRASNDTIHTFTAINAATSYSAATRYILLPESHDTVKLNSAIAQYTKSYEYYKVYNVSPAKILSTDIIKTWTISDSTGATLTRYLLAPSYDVTTNESETYINADKSSNQKYAYYTVYTNYPLGYNSKTDTVFSWFNSNAQVSGMRYMVVPQSGLNYVKRNDTVYNDTKKYCYYNWYSSSPYENNGERVITMTYNNSTVYMLLNPDDNEQTQNTRINGGSAGTYYDIPQK